MNSLWLWARRAALGLLFVCTILITAILGIVVYYIYSTNQTIPSIAEIDLYFDEQQASGAWIDPSSLPKHVTDSYLAAWDPYFFQFRPVCGLFRVLPALISDRRLSAGIADYVALELIREHSSYPSHSGRGLLHCKLEWFTSDEQKQQIFGVLLGTLYFGSDIYGIERAAASYFNKRASTLSVAEAAYLAGLVKAPSRYVADPELGLKQRNVVLDRMAKFGFVAQSVAEKAKTDRLNIALQSTR